MRFFFKWQNDIFLVTIVLLVVVLTWQNVETSHFTLLPGLQIYGGQLSRDVRVAIYEMDQHLTHATAIYNATSNTIEFQDEHFEDYTYHYAHQTLWRNNTPIVSSMASCSFEFRDSAGNLITRYPQVYTDIHQIGVTLHFSKNHRDISAHHKIVLTHGNDTPVQLAYQ